MLPFVLISFVHYFACKFSNINYQWHASSLRELAHYYTGTKVGRSLLIEDGVLPWIVQNANNEVSLVRRHIELALCHLAQHGEH